jgi:putative sterol carrier protein
MTAPGGAEARSGSTARRKAGPPAPQPNRDARCTARARAVTMQPRHLEIPMSADALLKGLPAAFNADAAAGTDCVLQFNSSNPHYVTIKNGSCTVAPGNAANADVTITMDDDDLVQLMKGELNGMTAFMTGKLQVDGDLMLAQRMSSFFDPAKLG